MLIFIINNGHELHIFHAAFGLSDTDKCIFRFKMEQRNKVAVSAINW